jgi:hypothetical protein
MPSTREEMRCSKLERRTESARPLCRTRSRTCASRASAGASSSNAERLSSMFRGIFCPGPASTSSSMGTPSPRNSGANQPPASRNAISSHRFSRTGPDPIVVRSSVSSWMTTGTRSAVSATSISTMSAPASIAPSMAAMVFSGYRPLKPRWAITRGRRTRKRRSIAFMRESLLASRYPRDMRIDVPTRPYQDELVVFDPEALAGLLGLGPDPTRAIARHRGKLEKEVRRGNAVVLDVVESEVMPFFVEEEPDEFWRDSNEEGRLLRVPSGCIRLERRLSRWSRKSGALSLELAEVEVGLYAVRHLHRQLDCYPHDQPDPWQACVIERHGEL